MRRLVSILLAVCLLCALGAAAAENMRSFFFGEAMSPETDALLTDPFLLPVSGGASPFDTYYGGFNTITGGTSGTDGRDGWYYRTLGK